MDRARDIEKVVFQTFHRLTPMDCPKTPKHRKKKEWKQSLESTVESLVLLAPVLNEALHHVLKSFRKHEGEIFSRLHL